MSILNLYQLAFLSTIVSTIVVANWARKQRAVIAQTLPTSPTITPEPSVRQSPIDVELSLKTMVPDLKKLTAPMADSVRERISALDKLFDENVISVDEYVELRKRALG